ncbi:hypothetical protein ACIQU6_22575 [Streptomyces sp. NPDC090442]|uniref:hypothetical protein n=1 Tax=Streptomyces sp. NPDC090442 TaxID=3365962 RepID=UPI00380326AA
MSGLAMGSSELLHHLLIDRAIKIAIVAAALGVVALGMAAIWRWAGRSRSRREGNRNA